MMNKSYQSTKKIIFCAAPIKSFTHLYTHFLLLFFLGGECPWVILSMANHHVMSGGLIIV